MKKRNKFAREDTKGLLVGMGCLLEVLLLSFMYYIVWRYGFEEGLFYSFRYKGKYVLMGVYAFLLFLVFQNSDCFLFGQLRRADIIMGQWVSLCIVNFITYFQLCLIANQMVSPLPIVVLFVLEMFLTAGLAFLYTDLYHRLYAPHNMVLIYGTDNALHLKIKMDSRRDKYVIDRLISTREGIEKIYRVIDQYDSVVLNDVPSTMRNDIIKHCYHRCIRVYTAPKIADIVLRGGKNISLFDTPLLLIKGNGLSLTQRMAKRTMDLILASVSLVIFAPIMVAVAAAIKLEDGGPVFYKQSRLTLNEREFDILKFRSMIVDAEKQTGAILASGNDPRITKVGRVIRATRLDELPQIINIIKGDMSIVGPRPERRKFVDEFCAEMPEFTYRMKVKGGLTGLAQVYGKYNTSPYDKLRLDMMYVENYSFLLDVKLILLTIRVIFSKESTEGIDIAKENEKKKDELLEEILKDSNHDFAKTGAKQTII